MAESSEESDLRQANFRLCRLCVWPNYGGLGFHLENTTPPPHVIQTVESNSPAAAGGLKILDLILAVNNQDASAADYKTVTQAIINARDSNGRIELLVIEKRFYEILKLRGVSFNPGLARRIDTPTTMPGDYMSFPKNIPRTCEIRLKPADQSFGFEVINGNRDIGAFIQEVVPNTPASRTALRKCDRILEIDDKFVDDEASRAILIRLTKAKQKRSVKLYVVDTSTYKFFQDNRVPLTSKEFRKSKFAKQIRQQPQPPISTYINVVDMPAETRGPNVNIPRPTYPTPTSANNQLPYTSASVTTPVPHQDDIRLCTINRANVTDTYGIELNFHRRDNYHSIKVTVGRDNAPSNAELAGVKTDDHLIEINGENIQNMGDEEVKQRIRVIKYPQPLQILVADSATYNYYNQQNKVIHSGLPSVKKLPGNIIDRPTSLTSSNQESSVPGTPTIVSTLINNNPIQPIIPLENSQSNRRSYKLHRIPGFQGYGFSVSSNQGGNISHKISQIAPHSPAAQQGLRVGDYILTVNDRNVEKMSANDFTQFLRTSAQNTETHGNPLLLEVINEDSYQPSALPDNVSMRNNVTDPPSTIPSINGSFIRQSSYYNPIEPTGLRNGSRKSSATQPTPSRNDSRKSSATQPTPFRNDSQKSSATQPKISRNGSRKLPTATTQSITSQNETPKLSTTQPITSLTGNNKSTTNQPISSGNENQKLPVNQPYTNGYNSSLRDQYSRSEIKPSEASSSLLYRSREHLSRGTVDVVSKNRLLRYCRLNIGPGQQFGFQLKSDNDKHIVYNIQPDSPAARAGLNENDCLIEVDDQDIEHKSSKEVVNLIRNATHNRTLRLFIAPNSVKVLSKRSAKSLSPINDDRFYRTKYNDQEESSSSTTSKYRSVPRLHGEQNYIRTEPTEPLPRKCVLQRDSSFRGCGFLLMEKDNYDTPIIIEISQNSPAQRSGLTEGDHIIYINSQNVQNFRSFNDIISLIKRTFEENGEITLITLTGPAYQVLKRRGGYLESLAFDYQSSSTDQLKPRLCKLKLYNREQDFGFTLQRNDYLYVKNIEENSSADINGLRKNDIILELNGKIAKNLTINQIKEITDISKQERKLDILVISIDGYQFAMKHAIPLNSLLFFVQTKEEQTTISNGRIQQEPVFL